MNGPDHYRQAEKLLEEAQQAVANAPGNADGSIDATLLASTVAPLVTSLAAAAQVHADLANTAALIRLGTPRPTPQQHLTMISDIEVQWGKAVGERG